MKRVKASRKEIAEQGWNLGIGYAEAPYILGLYKATLFASGLYGWACDYYPIDEYCGIVTGYNVSQTSDVYIWDLSERARCYLDDLDQKASDYKLNPIDKEGLKNDLVKFLSDIRNGDYDREWFVEYCGHIMGRGYSKGDAVKDFYKSRSELVASLRFDHTPKLKDCEITHD